MDISIFLASLAAAVLAPVLALAWLRPILLRVLRGLCDTEGTAEFWVRCATMLSVSGTVLLVMVAGEFGDDATLVGALRRVMFLTMTGVFVSVSIISRNVWNQARINLVTTQAAAAARARAAVAATTSGLSPAGK